MAQKRMFDKTITNADDFIEMPDSSQNLYFHLSMNADDDGFINNWKSIIRMTGHKEDDLKVLIMKNYIIPFESGVIVIRHWRINNYLRNDRYIPTKFQKELQDLYIDNNSVYQMDTTGIPSIDKISIEENSIDKISIEEKRDTCSEIITDRNDQKLKNRDLEREFEELWKLYPRKVAKKKALEHYKTSRKNGTTFEEVESGLYNYLDYIVKEKIDANYIKHGSTWFNQECWNDEYLVKRKKSLKDLSMAEIEEAYIREKEGVNDIR